MNRALLASAVAILIAVPIHAGGDPPKGFESLFNGKDLTGWKSTGNMKVWGADNGVIYCEGGGGGWLMTEKEFANFELRLEYKMPKGGNSGVGIRSPLKGDPAYVGMEIQLIDDEGWPGVGIAEEDAYPGIVHCEDTAPFVAAPLREANANPRTQTPHDFGPAGQTRKT